MIRKAEISHHKILTEIAFFAKQTWNYPEDYLEIWKDELTISEDYISSNTIFLFEEENKISGFISLVENSEEKMIGNILVEKGFWMDHLFILPQFQNKGIGKQLVDYLIEFCIENKIPSLLIFVDPNAVAFYEKLGAKFVRNSDSSIPERQLPVYHILIPQ